MRILLIGNPVSGRGKTSAVVREVVSCAQERGHEIEAVFTTSSGSACQLAANITPGFDCLMIAGGDGVINDVINGANLDTLPPLMVIATGTANMLARELSMPKTAPEIIKLVERGKTATIKLGLANEKRFLMLVSAGFDALVTKQIKENRPKRLGFRGYIKPALKALRYYRPAALNVTMDSQTKVETEMVIVGRINKYGGIFRFSRNSSLTSETFEVCVFRKATLTSIIKYGLLGLFRLSELSSEIQRFSARHVIIDSRPASPVEVDGDYFCETPVSIQLTGQAIQVITP